MIHLIVLSFSNDINCKNTFFIRAVRTNEIEKIILGLDSNKSIGPNSIPIYILKVFNKMFHLFLVRLSTWYLRLANVIPIYKNDDALLCENYIAYFIVVHL